MKLLSTTKTTGVDQIWPKLLRLLTNMRDSHVYNTLIQSYFKSLFPKRANFSNIRPLQKEVENRDWKVLDQCQVLTFVKSVYFYIQINLLKFIHLFDFLTKSKNYSFIYWHIFSKFLSKYGTNLVWLKLNSHVAGDLFQIKHFPNLFRKSSNICLAGILK